MKRLSSLLGCNVLVTAVLASFVLMTADTTSAQAQEDNPLIVEADDSLQWLRNEKQYVATGNATAQQGDLTLKANVITAHYESENTETGDHDATTITFIKGETAAKLTRASLIATANVIEYDIITEFVKIFGGSPLIINGQDRMSATEVITYNRSTREIIARGDAQVKLANGQELHGNIITIVITQDEGDIETVTADGNALVTSQSDTGQQRAVADTMVYTRTDGIAVLTGNVEIEDGNNLLTGDRAEVNTITGTSTMSSSQGGKRVGGVFNPAQ